MKTRMVVGLLALSLGHGAVAATDAATQNAATQDTAAATATERLDAEAAYEAVERFSTLGGLHSFRPLDRERLIVWRTPFEPYLIELAWPSVDLKFARGIAIDTATSQVHAGFDRIRIRGINYPIERIYRLTKAQAKAL